MSTELQALYQDVIVDHSKRPRNRRKLEEAARRAEGYNPLCGDKLTVYVELVGDVLRDVAFEGFSCAVCTASASVMTETLKGKAQAEASRLAEAFRAMVTQGSEVPGAPELGAFAGVRAFPSRVKCALLAWHTLQAALQQPGATVSTE